ncbi:MAG: transcription antitermination factor NusB [Desulfovibrionaceae bacterium]
MTNDKRRAPGAAPKGGRSLGREIAFQVLYGRPFVPVEEGVPLLRSFDRAAAVATETDKGRDFARELVLGVMQHQAQLDEVITRFSQNWKISRIARVELAILRLALYEMLHTDMPLKAAINEAVELSKRFGDENSRNFINGILDAAAKAVSRGELGPAKQF